MDEYLPGYPIDLRREEQRMKAVHSVTGDFEYSAARVVARFLGERVLLVDDGSADSMPDIRIEYADGRVGAVEVVLDMDPAWAATYAGVRKRHFRVAGPSVTRFWFASLKAHSDLRQLDRRLDGILADLETNGWPLNEYVELAVATDMPSEVQHGAELLVELGVRAVSCRADPAPGIQLVPSGTGGHPEDWPAFHAELTRVLHSDALGDVRDKLRGVTADEHHLFLGTTFSSSWSLNFWLRERHDELPLRDPDLPPGVTRLWIWGDFPPARALGWFPHGGWFDPSKTWATD